MTQQKDRDGKEGPAHTTVVLLCQGLQTLGKGLDLEELAHWLEGAKPRVRARVVLDLCRSPRELSRSAAGGVKHIVLGLCSADYPEPSMHSEARKAGLDPFGLEVLNLGDCTLPENPSLGMEKAKLLLTAAVARARAFPGSKPQSVRPSLLPLSQKVSRRALFTLPPMRYQPVAYIDSQRCVAEAGCRLCVQACPQGALEPVEGGIELHRMQCQGCGLCVTACPKEAVELPGSSLAQLQAQLTALLETDTVSLKERRILFTCQRSAQALGERSPDDSVPLSSWLPVPVPCIGMASVGCILQCLALGATAVGVMPCNTHCPLRQDETLERRIDYCRHLIRLLGGSPERVRIVAPGEEPEQPPAEVEKTRPREQEDEGSPPSMFGPTALAEALHKLAAMYGAPATLSLQHPYSPLGVLSVQRQQCTACGVCADVCITGALELLRDDTEVSLTFDPRLCIACGQCVAACPEASAGAIRIDRVTDLARLRQGRTVIRRDRETRCKACGAPVATLGMLGRVTALLGEEDGPLSELIAQYCPSCKGSPGLSPASTQEEGY